MNGIISELVCPGEVTIASGKRFPLISRSPRRFCGDRVAVIANNVLAEAEPRSGVVTAYVPVIPTALTPSRRATRPRLLATRRALLLLN